MSLDSSQTASIGAIFTPIATILNPALGLAVGAGFSLATAGFAADEQRALTARNIQIQQNAQRANELRQRRTDRQTQGRFLQRVASSGFTTRGSPIERFADLVAEQELSIQTDRFNLKLTVEDLLIRGDNQASQTQAAGQAAAAVGLGKSALTLLNRQDDFQFLE